MNRTTWTRYLIAAAIILIAGAMWALAEEVEMKVMVKNEGGETVTVDINGVAETVSIDDLADGEERTFKAGEHDIVVKRIGDKLTLTSEGGLPAKIHKLHGGDANMVWVTTDGKDGGDHKKIIVKKLGETEVIDADGNVMFVGEGHAAYDVLVLKDEDGEIDIEALKEKFGDDFEEIETGDGHRMLKWVREGGEMGEPIIIKTGGEFFVEGDKVHYRCEETGSTLIVDKDENLLDTYIDPITGCVLKKVDVPVKKVIQVEVITEEKDED